VSELTVTIPVSPTEAEEPSAVPVLGALGVAIDGVPMYGPTEGTGLTTEEQMGSLGTATGIVQGRLYLSLIRAHHIGGAHMADNASENAATRMVRAIAERMSACPHVRMSACPHVKIMKSG
jgi:hypothetical protein